MGMPITLEVIDTVDPHIVDSVFAYFREVDAKYSPYKKQSEVSRINEGLPEDQWSSEMQEIFALSEETKQATNGYFDIHRSDGTIDPSGLVKGWAIQNAAQLLIDAGVENFYLDVGGDIQVRGVNPHDQRWIVGIRNPFNRDEIVKILSVSDEGVATSGTYIRGQHIYDPHKPGATLDEVQSITVIGPNVYEADRFATAAFAMGREGIAFIERLPHFEAYMIDRDKVATMTRGFERYVHA